MQALKILWILLMTIIMFGFMKSCLANSVLDWLVNIGKAPLSSVAESDKSEQRFREFEDGPISVPFEDLGYEDKFLLDFLEAEKVNTITLSSLDRCEHKVVMKIQSSCSHMTEEELAKLSIRLLNCQSEISGRSQVLCSDTMTLKECVSPMDSETWNAYHVINNRARAVCYAIRQQQFRALSEMAVNKLMSSTLTQLTNMDNLQELQKELNLLTTDMMSSMRKGQLQLLDYTGELQTAQSRAQHTITNNMKYLALEQTMIRNTQNHLTMLSEKLAKQLETHGLHFDSVKDQQHRALEDILTSLSDITANTDALWNAIERKSQHILQQQEKIKKTNSEILENLKNMNMSILYLTNIVTQVKTEVERKVAWATDFIGGDGALLISVVLNALYLFAGVLVTLFLQLSLIYRLSLLVAFGTNTLLVYTHQSLGYVDLTVSIVGFWILFTLLAKSWFAFKKYMSNSKSLNNLEKKPKLQEDNDDNVSTRSSFRSESGSQSNINPKGNSYFTDHNDTDIHSFAGLHLRRSTSRTDSGSQLVCAALCRNGQSCRSTPTPGRQFCKRHLPH